MTTWFNKVKQALDIPFVPKIERPFAEYNEVPCGMGCPNCGEANIDQLLLQDDDELPDDMGPIVTCLTCHTIYAL